MSQIPRITTQGGDVQGDIMGAAMAGVGALLVELRNHSCLCVVYGEALAANAMHALREYVHSWGGSVTDSGPAHLLVTGLSTAPGSPAWISELERRQVELSAMVFASAGHRIRLVVTIAEVRDGGSPAAGEEHAFRLMEGPEHHSVQAPPRPAPPQFDWPWRVRYEHDMALAVSFDEALVQGRVHLVFQPITRYDHLSEETLYAEALLRICGEMTAFRVVPALERLGLVRGLDRVVVLAVLDRLENDPKVRLGCNISAHSAVSDAWWHSIFERLAEKPFAASRLTIEITETAPLPDLDIAVAFVQRLKSLGCRIALDDFGAGHSSVAFARMSRPDVIKLDGDWLQRSHLSNDGMRMFRRLAGLSQALASQVVAEGVERVQDLRVAFEVGVDWLQGWGVAPPAEPWPRIVLRVNGGR